MNVLLNASKIDDTGMIEVYNQARIIAANGSFMLHTTVNYTNGSEPLEEDIIFLESEETNKNAAKKIASLFDFFDFEEASLVTFERLGNRTEYAIEFRKDLKDSIEMHRYTLAIYDCDGREFLELPEFKELIARLSSKIVSSLVPNAA